MARFFRPMYDFQRSVWLSVDEKHLHVQHRSSSWWNIWQRLLSFKLSILFLRLGTLLRFGRQIPSHKQLHSLIDQGTRSSLLSSTIPTALHRRFLILKDRNSYRFVTRKMKERHKNRNNPERAQKQDVRCREETRPIPLRPKYDTWLIWARKTEHEVLRQISAVLRLLRY